MFESKVPLLEIVLRVTLISVFLVALRRENLTSPEEVELAVLEPDGRITVVPKKKDR